MIALDTLLNSTLYDLYASGQQVLCELDLRLYDNPDVKDWRDAQERLLQWLTDYEYAHKRYPPRAVDALWVRGFNAIEQALEALDGTHGTGETAESSGLPD